MLGRGRAQIGAQVDDGWTVCADVVALLLLLLLLV